MATYAPGYLEGINSAKDMIGQGFAQGQDWRDMVKTGYGQGLSIDQLVGGAQGLRPDMFGATAPGPQDFFRGGYGTNDSQMTDANRQASSYSKMAEAVAREYGNIHNANAPQVPGAAGYGGADFSGGNPYLGGMADDITRRVNLSRDMGLAGIRSNFVGSGGLGGTRQGVAEAQGIGLAADNLAGQLAGMYSGAWNADQNRNLQRYGIDTSADLTRRGQDQGFYTSQRGQDLTQLGMGANIYDMGARGGWIPLNNASGIFNAAAGNNVTSTSGSQQGGGAFGLLGGALSGAALGQQMGLWGR